MIIVCPFSTLRKSLTLESIKKGEALMEIEKLRKSLKKSLKKTEDAKKKFVKEMIKHGLFRCSVEIEKMESELRKIENSRERKGRTKNKQLNGPHQRQAGCS